MDNGAHWIYLLATGGILCVLLVSVVIVEATTRNVPPYLGAALIAVVGAFLALLPPRQRRD